MRCLSGTSKSTAGASAPALRMSGACARNLVPPIAPPRPAKGWPGDTFCTCVFLNSEAGGPKKGRKSGCVAAGRGDLGEAGSALTFSNWCTHVRVVGRGRLCPRKSLTVAKTTPPVLNPESPEAVWAWHAPAQFRQRAPAQGIRNL
ncbi:unnamed protein product [Rangifer tarandus platyrhynchus]|uniref:Uncharacterized protein n=1 Tax=Rangifer tarandus platyrhynchus TaxID=3082113 RepID=A0AC59ZSV6_RANTA